MSLQPGLRVLITAAGSGIGRVMLDVFHRQGARVHVCDVSAELLQEVAAAHPDVGTTVADVSLPAQVDRLFDEAAARFGGLDVLVNNAGIAGSTGPVETLSPDDWDRTISVNLNGQFYCVRRAVPLLKAAGGGSIINISSVAGRLGYPLRSPYAASKWAVVGFTKSIAMELGPQNIRVNAILPGIVRGPRIDAVIADKAKDRGVTFEQMREEYTKQVSLRKMVSPEDVAQTAVFLCSEAGRHITGQAISVCGNVERLS